MPDSTTLTAGPVRVQREAWLPLSALSHAVGIATLVAVVATAAVLFGLDGWKYYSTPLPVRGYSSAHHALRPGGYVGHPLGIVGIVIMMATLFYPLRKRWKRLSKSGSIPRWLEWHVVCGLVGPTFITFHTSFKFNGIVSVAYWSMVIVVLSGFVGRYLYVRIPRTLRGTELARQGVEERAEQLKAELFETTLPTDMLLKVEAFERDITPPPGTKPSVYALFVGDLRARWKLRGLKAQIRGRGMKPEILEEASHLIAERVFLLRRAAALSRTKKLFDLWHVFHLPLVYVMFGIAILHVAVALYFGYWGVRW